MWNINRFYWNDNMINLPHNKDDFKIIIIIIKRSYIISVVRNKSIGRMQDKGGRCQGRYREPSKAFAINRHRFISISLDCILDLRSKLCQQIDEHLRDKQWKNMEKYGRKIEKIWKPRYVFDLIFLHIYEIFILYLSYYTYYIYHIILYVCSVW